MKRLGVRRVAVIIGFALIGWALCAATMGIGMSVLGLRAALAVHAVAAPVFFAVLSWVYFKRFAYTTPLVTAAFFVAVVVFMDVVVVAMHVPRSFAMVGSFLGTWLPFALIFGSTYLTGLAVGPPGKQRARELKGGGADAAPS
jgi:hypothetical protein